LGLEIFTLRERPDLRPAIFLPDLQFVWPEFMRHDATATLYFAPSQFEAYLDYAFAGSRRESRRHARSACRLPLTLTAVMNCQMAAGTK